MPERGRYSSEPGIRLRRPVSPLGDSGGRPGGGPGGGPPGCLSDAERASGVHTDDQLDEVGGVLLLDAGKGGASRRPRDMIVAVDRVAGRPTPIRRRIEVQKLRQRVGKEYLPGQDVLLVEEDLEVDVRRAAAVPPGIDCVELHDAASVGHLGPAQKRLALIADLAAVAAVGRVDAVRVTMPNVDARPLNRRAVRADDLKAQNGRYALAILADVAAQKVGVRDSKDLR
jgi:hypothetical protein